MPEKPELKPCPWCGKAPQVDEQFAPDYWSVRCQNDRCKVLPATGEFRNKKTAIRAWNTRPEPEEKSDADSTA